MGLITLPDGTVIDDGQGGGGGGGGGSSPISGLAGLSPGALQNIMTLLGLGGQFGAAALQQGQLNKGFDYLNGIGQTALGQNQGNLGNATGIYGQQAGGLQGLLDGSNPWSQALSQGLMGNIQTLNNLLPGLVQPGQNQSEFSGLANNQIYQDPNSTAALRGITGLTGNTNGMLNAASQLINSGGQTSSQVPLGSYAQALMNGLNPNQMALQGTGTSILGSQGMTPALAAALAQASGVVSSQGQTGLTNQLAQLGLGMAGKNPLLSGADAASIAQDQSGRNFANLAQSARTQAENRGNGPGDIVGNGIGNGTQADFADQALSQGAQAAQAARLGQQGLGLQQQQQGLSTGLNAAGMQNQLELGGLGAVGGLTGASTNLLGTGGGLTNSAAQLGNQGASFYNQLLGLQQGNQQMGFQAGNQNVQSQAGLMQQAIQDLMTGQNNAASTGNSLANLYLGNQNQLASGIGQGLGTNLSALGQLGSQGGNWLQAALGALGTYGGTGSSVANLLKQPNAYSTVLNNLGGSLASGGLNAGGVKIGLPNININTGGGAGGSYFDGLGGALAGGLTSGGGWTGAGNGGFGTGQFFTDPSYGAGGTGGSWSDFFNPNNSLMG